MALDRIDAKILDVLQEDGRIQQMSASRHGSQLWEMASWVSSVRESNRSLWPMPSSTRSPAGDYPANLATVAWCTAMVLAIDRQLSPAARRFRASACWCTVSLGLRPNRVPLALAAVRPSFARLRIRCLSSSASADKKARIHG